MKRKNLPVALYLFLVFASGGVVGALGYRTYNPPTARTINNPAPLAPNVYRQQYLEESRTRLGLSDDQVQKLAAILDQTDARFRQIRQHENEMIRQIRDDHVARVRTILTAEQIPKYEQLHAEREVKAQQQQKKH